MPVVTVKGIGVHVQELNQGAEETVVMIHGMFGNLSQFYLTLAPHLAKRSHIVLYDIKSHGRSDRAATGYDLISLTDDMLALMDSLTIRAAHFIGFSYGALMALKFATRFPHRTNKLVLIEAPPKPDEPMKGKGNYYFEDFQAFALSLPQHVIKSFFRNERQVMKIFKMYEYIINETSFVHDMNAEKDFEEAELKGISHEILLMYGKKSICHEMGRKLFSELKDPHLVMREGDHGFFMSNCGDVAQDIDTFFEDSSRLISYRKIKELLKND